MAWGLALPLSVGPSPGAAVVGTANLGGLGGQGQECPGPLPAKDPARSSGICDRFGAARPAERLAECTLLTGTLDSGSSSPGAAIVSPALCPLPPLLPGGMEEAGVLPSEVDGVAAMEEHHNNGVSPASEQTGVLDADPDDASEAARREERVVVSCSAGRRDAGSVCARPEAQAYRRPCRPCNRSSFWCPTSPREALSAKEGPTSRRSRRSPTRVCRWALPREGTAPQGREAVQGLPCRLPALAPCVLAALNICKSMVLLCLSMRGTQLRARGPS